MKKNPILEDSFYDEWILLCPKCGESFLHQIATETWFREHEDSLDGVHVQSWRDQHNFDNEMKHNPSSRRDACVITFQCEFCGPSFLIFNQHKGQTFVKFEHFSKEEKPKSHKERYHEYLESPEWDEKRKAKLSEAGFRCQLCNAEKPLSVHHRTYDRVFDELQEDLIALCEKCHQKFHDIAEAHHANP